MDKEDRAFYNVFYEVPIVEPVFDQVRNTSSNLVIDNVSQRSEGTYKY